MVDARPLSARYHLEEEIATGGMGKVYAATDQRLGRRVAVKLLKPELAQDPKFVERFRREARSAAALSHPNIASVFDYGEERGQHFIVMECVTGRDLSRLLREEGPLRPERAAAIAEQAARALGYAHRAGVVHRDVKPANIIVGDDDHVKVTDFGIARAGGDPNLTATGSVLGTPNYISPEQAQGGEVTAASDLYSLGIVLYEMLSGAVPFTGDSALAIAMRHVSEPVPPPSRLNPDVPPVLDRAVARATAKEPGDRFQSGQDMARALAEIGSPTGASTLVDARGDGAGTAVLPAAADATTRALGVGTPWTAGRLARTVVVAIGGLALVALLLLVVRVAQGDDEAGAQKEGAQRRRTAQPVNRTPPSGVLIPGDLEGLEFDVVEEYLKGVGLKVEKVDDPESPLPKDRVSNIYPDPGATVPVGSAVTVYVSTGEASEEDNDNEDGPGNSEKSKGRGKGHEKD